MADVGRIPRARPARPSWSCKDSASGHVVDRPARRDRTRGPRSVPAPTRMESVRM